MNKIPTLPNLLAIVAFSLIPALAMADGHISSALKETKEATTAGSDSKAIAQHVTEALKHIDEARREIAPDKEAFKLLQKSEEDLKSALQKASRYNTSGAIDEAKEAQQMLENIKHQ